ncbi:MAG: YggS family pyridoxal phosphate-dependent enzyme [Rickettsiales bacterium]|nr:YggS family pyridoxal phosphate-dependent enzyme [Rickettsiales bacterium]
MNKQYLKNFQEVCHNSKIISQQWNRAEPNLVVVSKKRTTEEIIQFVESTGHICYAENYVKEAEEKYTIIKELHPNIKLHLIGHLQSNKALDAVKLFDVIETIDSFKIAEKLDKIERDNDLKRQYLIQVNIGEEEQKSGVNIEDLSQLVNDIRKKLSINLRGLMCVPPKGKNPSIYFAFLKKLGQENQLDYLSMGMSDDFKEAIAIGTDEIRVGTALFVK